ncbi:MAG: leucine-rich repeat domain-containing protein [Promethearchaeota archaeon]|jgi:Leucine-rich repeat (LRR) protein
MKEFRVNNFITLRLEGGNTIIYVADEKFQQCKFLLFNIIVDKLSTFDEIESIDAAAERLDKSMEATIERTISIPSETEFWGHCSNLQVWYENNYDTRLLHSNLAFPLLKKLVDVGDPAAKKIFKEEIAKRFTSNNLTVVSFLTKRKYFKYLEIDELKALKDDLSDKTQSCIRDILLEMFQEAFKENDDKYQNNLFEILSIFSNKNELEQFKYVICKEKKYFVNKGFLRIKDVDNIREIQGLNTLKGVKRLVLRGKNLSEIWCLDNLIELEELNIRGTQINKIENLENLPNLQILDLGNNQIFEIDGLSSLTNLKRLHLDSNNISEIKNLENLERLIELRLDFNEIKKIKSLDKLYNLYVLSLIDNHINRLENLENLKNLETLDLSSNKISEIEGVEYLINLKYLTLRGNQISEIKGLNFLKKLSVLNLERNKISEIKGLRGLYSLELLVLDDNRFLDPYDNREYEEEELVEYIY